MYNPAIHSVIRNRILSSSRVGGKEKGNEKEERSFSSFLLFQEREIRMEVKENEKIIVDPIKYQYVKEEAAVGWYWVGVAGEKRTIANTVEKCIEKLVNETKAKEFQLIPKTIEKDSVSEFILVLKVNIFACFN